MTFVDPYNKHIREISEKAERERERNRMLIINHYRTPNMELLFDRSKEYLNKTGGGRGTKNYNINKIKFFRDIPDGIEVLIDYIDVTTLRVMNIPTGILYESIYRELPELFEE